MVAADFSLRFFKKTQAKACDYRNFWRLINAPRMLNYAALDLMQD